ncbi:MAG: hypothetical protein V7607_561 [Solirubrobacteraceae bacterium]
MTPEGLGYEEEFLTPDEERDLLALFETVEFRPVEMRGQVARRTVRHFGLDHDCERGDLVPADPIPEGMRRRSGRGSSRQALMEGRPSRWASTRGARAGGRRRTRMTTRRRVGA